MKEYGGIEIYIHCDAAECGAEQRVHDDASRRQESPALVGPRWPPAWPEESAAGTSPAKERTAARLANRVGSPSRPRIGGACPLRPERHAAG